MYKLLLLSLLTTANCASYQRYGVTTPQYGLGQYSTYAPITNMYDTNYRSSYGNDLARSSYGYDLARSSYGNDLATFPRDGSRYPNYNPSGAASGLGSGYNTYGSGMSNVNNGYYGSGGLYNQAGNPYQQSGYYSTQRYGEGFSSYEMPFMRGGMGEYCQNRSPQNGIWVDNLMGMWYGVEVVQHLAGDSRVDLSLSCIVIHLSEPADQPSSENPLFHVQHIKAKFRQEHRHLRLLWDEAGQTVEYALYFRNDSAGYWQVFNGQNGTLAQRSTYQPFSGTVQVLKAVNDHLVLSFCQEPENGRQAQLYSVLFSREPGNMPRWEVESIHNMLQNKKLSIASRRMVCGNSADKALSSAVFSVFTCVIALAIGGKY